MESQQQREPTSLPEKEGEFAGLSYRVVGSGPPVILLPLALAPSQWEPLVPRLSKQFCMIILGGEFLGQVLILESRGGCAGYLRVVANLIDEANPKPGESILVSCTPIQ